MSQYKNRVNLERKLIKKVNRWFGEYHLMGLSIDSIEIWVSKNFGTNNLIGVQKIFEISDRLKAMANRSQEVVDPMMVDEVELIKNEVEELKREDFILTSNQTVHNDG